MLQLLVEWKRSEMTNATTVPLLTRYATRRQAGQDIPGQYCPQKKMWVVSGANGNEPLIAKADSLTELTTKTKVDFESDDTAEFPGLQLVTKTDVQTERDDESRLAVGVLALTTKTEVTNEQDKQDVGDWGSALADMMTKTLINVEEDRQDTDERFTAAYDRAERTAAPQWPLADISLPLAIRLLH